MTYLEIVAARQEIGRSPIMLLVIVIHRHE
jgi:hypothetical protein